jgi:hypothetical protein
MEIDPLVRRVAVGLIRSGNASVISPGATDDDVLSLYGDAAEPFARAIVETIRDVVNEALVQ